MLANNVAGIEIAKFGVEYHFWTRERFEAAISENAFLEWAEVFGNFYGTLRSEVEPFRAQGVSVFLDIDVQGAAQVRKVCPDTVTVFLQAPSLEIYEQRLRGRGTETEEAIQRRLQGAKRELERAGEYQYVVINDDLDKAVAELRALSELGHERPAGEVLYRFMRDSGWLGSLAATQQLAGFGERGGLVVSVFGVSLGGGSGRATGCGGRSQLRVQPRARLSAGGGRAIAKQELGHRGHALEPSAQFHEQRLARGAEGGAQLREGARTRAFLNICPHAGHRLDWSPGQFLIDQGRLVCAVHGAFFERVTGLCVSGPCRGSSLRQVAVVESDGWVLLDPS